VMAAASTDHRVIEAGEPSLHYSDRVHLVVRAEDSAVIAKGPEERSLGAHFICQFVRILGKNNREEQEGEEEGKQLVRAFRGIYHPFQTLQALSKITKIARALDRQACVNAGTGRTSEAERLDARLRWEVVVNLGRSRHLAEDNGIP